MKQIQNLFGQSLKRLSFRVHHNNDLLKLTQGAVPGFVAAHCLICSASPPVMTILVDSPAWISRLRFYSPKILETVCQKHGNLYSKIEFKVKDISTTPVARAPKTPTAPPSSIADQLSDTAANMSESPLKNSLSKLASTIRSLDKNSR